MTADEFIAEWWGKPGGSERSNFAPFIADLCDLLGEKRPGQSEKGKLGEYEYEGAVPRGSFRSLDASGSIDLYKRGCFIMEAKQSYLRPEQTDLDLGEPSGPRAPSGARYDRLMRDARAQAENYAKNLPASEPVAPFVIVCDIGRAFEIYHDAAGNGRGYTFFPDKQSYRIELRDLASDRELKGPGKTPLELLKAIWSDPRSVDPRFQAADVTRKVAASLAEVSKVLEEGTRLRSKATTAREKAEEIEESALFLMRILFCMFAEDIGLLPEERFKDFLLRAESNDRLFEQGLADLWQKMGAPNIEPRFAHSLEAEVPYFNGGLFTETARTFKLNGFDIHHLYVAAKQNWRKVEPAIFGTLLEQALSPEERAKLGAHYTPRPYVETLVRATIMDVLEPEWAAVEEEIGKLFSPPSQGGDQGVGASLEQARSGLEPDRASPTPSPSLEREGRDKALALATAFHERLASIRVLDPACGTGNFLYVSMELMQALESRVIETIEMLGGSAEPKVGPHQFYGLEKNPRAAKIAELVLWIGWLRNRLSDDPGAVPQPVLAESANINFGRHGGYDAVLRMNDMGEPDLEAPAPPKWPEAEFIVGNPPFIGGKDIRDRLGSGYAEALWKANPRVPKSADFVMQWWDRAAHRLVAKGSVLRRFGFVTTNSITQEFSRRVIAQYLSPPSQGGDQGVGASLEQARSGIEPDRASPTPDPSLEGRGGLSLVTAIPDHPWTRAGKDSAAVRIAMTVAERGAHEGELREVVRESGLDSDEPKIEMTERLGTIHANLSGGANVTTASALRASEGLASPGVKLHGAGFIVAKGDGRDLGLGTREGLERHLRPYRNGRDLLGRSRDALVIDLFGLSEKEVRGRFPEVFDQVYRTVKPERDSNRRATYRDNWWIFGEPRRELRDALAGLPRYIATVETSKHRIFQFLDAEILPDNKLLAVGSDDAFVLGVLQSAIHVQWSLVAGGWLGVGNDSVYVKSKVFDPFPFPDASPEQRAVIAELAEELDSTRKSALAETDGLTMTELYNLVQWVRSSKGPSTASRSPSPAKAGEEMERRAAKARAGIVDRLHGQIDQAVADAYGWGEEWKAGRLGPSEIVARLVALNQSRAAEEAAGTVRWLRPDYQAPRFGKTAAKEGKPRAG